MTPPLTFNHKPLSPDISAILERMVHIHPALTDGDSNLTEEEALRLLDFAPNNAIDACDIVYFNEGLSFSETIPADDFKKVYQALSSHSKKIKALRFQELEKDFRVELTEKEICKIPRSQIVDRTKTYLHEGIEVFLRGFSVHIDESLLKVATHSAAEMNRVMITPTKRLEIEWCEGLDLPANDPNENSMFSGVFAFGAKVASVGVTYKLATQMLKELDQRGRNWALGRSPGEKSSNDFMEAFSPLLNQAQKRWDLFELFDPSRYQPDIPQGWGFSFHKKHDIYVEGSDLFAAIAVTARYFGKEFHDKLKALPEGETKSLALRLMNLVSTRIGVTH